jgi:hypothetical protein
MLLPSCAPQTEPPDEPAAEEAPIETSETVGSWYLSGILMQHPFTYDCVTVGGPAGATCATVNLGRNATRQGDKEIGEMHETIWVVDPGSSELKEGDFLGAWVYDVVMEPLAVVPPAKRMKQTGTVKSVVGSIIENVGSKTVLLNEFEGDGDATRPTGLKCWIPSNADKLDEPAPAYFWEGGTAWKYEACEGEGYFAINGNPDYPELDGYAFCEHTAKPSSEDRDRMVPLIEREFNRKVGSGKTD